MTPWPGSPGSWHPAAACSCRPGPGELAARSGGRPHLGRSEPGHGPDQTSPPRPPGWKDPRLASRSCRSGIPPPPWNRSPRRPEPISRAPPSGGACSSATPCAGTSHGDRTAAGSAAPQPGNHRTDARPAPAESDAPPGPDRCRESTPGFRRPSQGVPAARRRAAPIAAVMPLRLDQVLSDEPLTDRAILSLQPASRQVERFGASASVQELDAAWGSVWACLSAGDSDAVVPRIQAEF